MKRIQITILAVTAAIVLGSFYSCRFHCVRGSGNQATENRKVEDFTRIKISGGFKIVLKQDSSLSVKITADDNLLKYIKTEVEGYKLHIYTRKNMCNTGEMTVYIGVRNLEEINASGAVDVETDGKLQTQDFRIKLSGATRLTMDMNAANVTTSGSGATELHLKGQASSHDIDLSGSGKVYALDFVVGNCNIQTSGVGHSEVNVLHSLSVHSSGA